MLDAKAIAYAAGGYLKHHPHEVLRAARNAAALRFGLPIAAFEWLAGHIDSKKMPQDLTIEARPPGVHIAASFDLMHTPLRATATIYIERLRFNADELRVEVRLADVTLKVLDNSVETPIAALLRSGALDLSKPGNLVAYMPKRPAILVEAKDDRIALDLIKLSKLDSERARRALALILPLAVLRSVETDAAHLDLEFEAFPDGVREALAALRRSL